MKLNYLFIMFSLIFVHLDGMEEVDCVLSLSKNGERKEINEACSEPESLVQITTKFLAYKLIADIKREVEGEKEVDILQYFTVVSS